MATISKRELISNLKDKISQFKSNYSKNKESRKDTSDFNFEINKDALKYFYKNKSETGGGEENSQEHKKPNNIDDLYDFKKILEEKKTKSSLSNNINKIEKEEKKVDTQMQENKNDQFCSKIKKNFSFGGIETNEEEKEILNQNEKGNELNKLNVKTAERKESFNQKNDNFNINSNMPIKNEAKNINFDNNKKNNFNFEYENYKNNKFNQKINIRDNNALGPITLHNSNYNDFNIEGIMKNRKDEKREKSAPKTNINQKSNNYFIQKPLTDKHNQNDLNNIKKNNLTTNYNTNNEFNVKKTNNTEELYQKLLVNFNINSNNKNINNSFYNFNSNNKNYNKENNPNKSYGQINIKDINLLYEINSGSNTNNYNQKKNYFRNEMNLDHLKDLYSKKTEGKPSQTNLKPKIDLFYQELNDYKKSNNYKNPMLKNYYTNDEYLNNKYSSNTQYNNFIRNSNNNSSNKSKNYLQNFNFNERANINNNINDLSYNEIHAFKQYLKDLSEEEMNNLPFNVKSELRDIFNILYQKFKE